MELLMGYNGVKRMNNDNKSAYDSSIYDEHIVNVLPYYREYHDQIIDLVQAYEQDTIDWLDTGCGTGTLASRVLEKGLNVRFTLCDPSEKMLNEAQKKLKDKSVSFIKAASHELDLDSEYDVISAVQSHHYYRPDERAKAVSNCYRALRDGGVFITFENIRMSSDASDAIAMKRWVTFLRDRGNSEQEIKMQIDRRGVETFPITVEQHIDLLKRSGFKSVDILWASYLQAGFMAIK